MKEGEKKYNQLNEIKLNLHFAHAPQYRTNDFIAGDYST